MSKAVATIPRQDQTMPAIYEHDRHGFALNSNSIAQCAQVAHLMAQARVTVPEHLRGKEGDCFAIALQAAQWGMNPFVVAQKTHVVSGTLGYEAQLVSAVATSSGALASVPDYRWEGDWSKVNGKTDNDDSRACTVSATLRGESVARSLRVSMAQVGPARNSPLWPSDPRQQLAYVALKKFIRLHAPGALMGVYSVDELQDCAPQRIEATVVDAQPPAQAAPQQPAAPTYPPEVVAARRRVVQLRKDLGWSADDLTDWISGQHPGEESAAMADPVRLAGMIAALEGLAAMLAQHPTAAAEHPEGGPMPAATEEDLF